MARAVAKHLRILSAYFITTAMISPPNAYRIKNVIIIDIIIAMDNGRWCIVYHRVKIRYLWYN